MCDVTTSRYLRSSHRRRLQRVYDLTALTSSTGPRPCCATPCRAVRCIAVIGDGSAAGREGPVTLTTGLESEAAGGLRSAALRPLPGWTSPARCVMPGTTNTPSSACPVCRCGSRRAMPEGWPLARDGNECLIKNPNHPKHGPCRTSTASWLSFRFEYIFAQAGPPGRLRARKQRKPVLSVAATRAASRCFAAHFLQLPADLRQLNGARGRTACVRASGRLCCGRPPEPARRPVMLAVRTLSMFPSPESLN